MHPIIQMMNKRLLISFFLLISYTVLLGHSIIPHHHHHNGQNHSVSFEHQKIYNNHHSCECNGIACTASSDVHLNNSKTTETEDRAIVNTLFAETMLWFEPDLFTGINDNRVIPFKIPIKGFWRGGKVSSRAPPV